MVGPAPGGPREATCVYALINNKRSVSRRNRASWYLEKLNKTVACCDTVAHGEDELNSQTGTEQDDTPDIHLMAATFSNHHQDHNNQPSDNQHNVPFIMTPSTRVLFLSRSIATSIVLDLSPSMVSVGFRNDRISLEPMFEAVKKVLHLLVKDLQVAGSSFLKPDVYIFVMAYTPFVVARSNQVIIQNRKISQENVNQVLAEIVIHLNRLFREMQELVSSTCTGDHNLEPPTTDTTGSSNGGIFTFQNSSSNIEIIRHPEAVLEDIFELGMFSLSLMPKHSRLSLLIITDGILYSTNNLNIFRLRSIAVSFVHLGSESIQADSCFGYTPYNDLMKFVAAVTQGVYLNHESLIDSSSCLQKQSIKLEEHLLLKLFSWTLHADVWDDFLPLKSKQITEKTPDDLEATEQITRFFCLDRPINQAQSSSKIFQDWCSCKHMERDLDSDFEQVLSCLLREGYLIKSIQFKEKDTTRIVMRLILYWRHNLYVEQELSASCWTEAEPYHLTAGSQLIKRSSLDSLLYGDTHCEISIHGSYSFLHRFYCDKKLTKKRSEYREIAYKQFKQLIDGLSQTHDRLQYLSRFYREPSLSKVPSFLIHGNSLLYEQPHTHNLTTTVDNVMDEHATSEFQEYWQNISCLDTKSWKNLMHIHTLRLVLEHDQPKYKNIHCQNVNGRYTHVQCRRALSSISTFIKSYASFALLEDTTYVKFVHNIEDNSNDDDNKSSSTKGFIVIRIVKLLPIVLVHLMFTSGILDCHRASIVLYISEELKKCKLRNVKISSLGDFDNILKTKTISSSGDSCSALIKCPIERMLKVYTRNFVRDYLLSNWSYGLPGSCPYTPQRSVKIALQNENDTGNNESSILLHKSKCADTNKDSLDNCSTDSSLNKYNLVLGKYLYGVRAIITIGNLPHNIVSHLIANVLSKISAILVNLRIKQGFFIAFNNSGILNLVSELSMKGHSSDDLISSCLCQYVVFPPSPTKNSQALRNLLTPSQHNGTTSLPGSVSGSLTNSETYLKSALEQDHLKVDGGEIKLIKEYWIEQQYGVSIAKNSYHSSLVGKKYPEVLDHLLVTDSSIFECLLNYEFLQLLCDKQSTYYKLDTSFFQSQTQTPLPSPTDSTNSLNLADREEFSKPVLPSTFIEGKNTTLKIPLIERSYKFSVVQFLNVCHLSSVNTLLFRYCSAYHKKELIMPKSWDSTCNDNFSSSICGSSLNEMFLDTLHKRLKQMHDKELSLSESDLEKLSPYLKNRLKKLGAEVGLNIAQNDILNWRCFLRTGNQDNLMIVFTPATLRDVVGWLNFIHDSSDTSLKHDPICPIFVFRCSGTRVNDHIVNLLQEVDKDSSETDNELYFGQPSTYIGKHYHFDDELKPEEPVSAQMTTTDEGTLETMHFKAFLRKIKNTVLKSRFNSLNDAYFGELFIHKSDILYYCDNVDTESQKKYHLSTQLKNLSEFIKSYEDYNESLPKEPKKPCNPILNSILLQKCGLFINQPIARFNESNPLMRQLHDKKLLSFMRLNYKVEFLALGENLASSDLLKKFIKSSAYFHESPDSQPTVSMAISSSTSGNKLFNSLHTCPLSRSEDTKLLETRSTFGSPKARLGSNNSATSTSSLSTSAANDEIFLEVFKGHKSCSIRDVPQLSVDMNDVSSRHEAHMVEVLRRHSERKQTHQYRKVLKSKSSYNHSHAAIDQALKRVESLGRLEHFCLTPLLFSSSWRSKLAPVRDHTIESAVSLEASEEYPELLVQESSGSSNLANLDENLSAEQAALKESENRWHQAICNNYIKEYEQYIQTLGFNSVQFKYQFHPKSRSSVTKSWSRKISRVFSSSQTHQDSMFKSDNLSAPSNAHPQQQQQHTLPPIGSGSYNTGYLIKFLNSGCLVFKVGFCKPYVYSILYSIEGERFNDSNAKMNMAAFLDELDNIKVTMHLHSFTYDYHLRCMHSFISGRQLNFAPGHNLVSFLDEFRRYYQKAPNYARNQILSGDISVANLKISGQQLYNYIVTHNTSYSMEVLEMSSSIMASEINHRINHTGNDGLGSKNSSRSQPLKSHANDYVLIELKREKVRYRDGKESDVFDCGLLITHDTLDNDPNKNCLKLKYFLILTNQKDLYPKLSHTYENIVNSGCHRPIRFGQQAEQTADKTTSNRKQLEHKTSATTAPSSGLSDSDEVKPGWDLQSSCEISSTQSNPMASINSGQSSSSGLQFALSTASTEKRAGSDRSSGSNHNHMIPRIEMQDLSEDFNNLDTDKNPRPQVPPSSTHSESSYPVSDNETNHLATSFDGSSLHGEGTLQTERKRMDSVNSNGRATNMKERVICDEAITYLGYFSSDEMDMLRFLEEKTANLRSHIEQVVRMAEIHYRRDYLWHKLMQRTGIGNKPSDEMPLNHDEMLQLLSILEAIDVSTLDPQLYCFTTMNVGWYLKLIRALAELKQSSANQHRIYVVKGPRLVVLFIDPKCTTALIMLKVDTERNLVELNLMLKDKEEYLDGDEQSKTLELSEDCRQLINDFISFCGAFMWSTLFT